LLLSDEYWNIIGNSSTILRLKLNNNPLVSIVTPSYNQGDFIEQCMLSIINQTYQNIEHIIMDGKSNDNTLNILKKYEGKYNMKWTSCPDDGMYDAINKGFELAQGEILAYLNCDDLYLPWSAEVAAKYLQTTNIIFGDSIICDKNMNKAYLSLNPPFISGYYKSTGVIVQPTVFFRREVFRKIGKFNYYAFALVADCDYWLRCAVADLKPRQIFEFLAIQRDHELTQRVTKYRMLEKEFEILRAKYSTPCRIKSIYYRSISLLYWRVAFLLYCSHFTLLWNKARNAGIAKLGWWRLIQEVISPWEKRMSLVSKKPYMQLGKVLPMPFGLSEGWRNSEYLDPRVGSGKDYEGIYPK
jgi:glycosyltransferase involved in cell wall biosynthesis